MQTPDPVPKKIPSPDPVPEKIPSPDWPKSPSESSWQEPPPGNTPPQKRGTPSFRSNRSRTRTKTKTITENSKKDFRPIEEIVPISEIKISFKIPKKIQILRPEKFSLHQILQNSDDSDDEGVQPPTLKVTESGRLVRTAYRRATTIYDEPDNLDLIYTKLLNHEANPIIGRISNTHKNILKTLIHVSKDDMKVTSLYIIGLRLTVFCCLKHLSLKEMIENPLPAHLKSKIINQFDILEKVGHFSAGHESSAKKKTKVKIILEQITTWGAVVKLMDNIECKGLISGYWEVVPKKKKKFIWGTHLKMLGVCHKSIIWFSMRSEFEVREGVFWRFETLEALVFFVYLYKKLKGDKPEKYRNYGFEVGDMITVDSYDSEKERMGSKNVWNVKFGRKAMFDRIFKREAVFSYKWVNGILGLPFFQKLAETDSKTRAAFLDRHEILSKCDKLYYWFLLTNEERLRILLLPISSENYPSLLTSLHASEMFYGDTVLGIDSMKSINVFFESTVYDLICISSQNLALALMLKGQEQSIRYATKEIKDYNRFRAEIFKLKEKMDKELKCKESDLIHQFKGVTGGLNILRQGVSKYFEENEIKDTSFEEEIYEAEQQMLVSNCKKHQVGLMMFKRNSEKNKTHHSSIYKTILDVKNSSKGTVESGGGTGRKARTSGEGMVTKEFSMEEIGNFDDGDVRLDLGGLE